MLTVKLLVGFVKDLVKLRRDKLWIEHGVRVCEWVCVCVGGVGDIRKTCEQ